MEWEPILKLFNLSGKEDILTTFSNFDFPQILHGLISETLKLGDFSNGYNFGP